MKNNSQEMNTIVETFIIEETASLIYSNEDLQKYNSLCEELGLKGQSSIKVKDKSPIPFMHLKKTMCNVFETLCPCKVDVKDYSITPIPIEILELCIMSERECYFNAIEIWYDDIKPDPVCVGRIAQPYVADCKENPKELWRIDKKDLTEEQIKTIVKWTLPTWSSNYYLLGKWADVKHSFKELIALARERYVSELGVQLRKELKETQRKLDDLELTASERFGSSPNSELPF